MNVNKEIIYRYNYFDIEREMINAIETTSNWESMEFQNLMFELSSLNRHTMRFCEFMKAITDIYYKLCLIKGLVIARTLPTV